jgi:hypothetical protein
MRYWALTISFHLICRGEDLGEGLHESGNEKGRRAVT